MVKKKNKFQALLDKRQWLDIQRDKQYWQRFWQEMKLMEKPVKFRRMG